MIENKNEAQTRTEMIDSQLAHAGWSKSRRSLVEEYLLKTSEPEAGSLAEQFADYVLLGSDGNPIAIVEAKRSSRDELAEKRQAADYADAIKVNLAAIRLFFSPMAKKFNSGIAHVTPRERSPVFTLEMIWSGCGTSISSPSRLAT